MIVVCGEALMDVFPAGVTTTGMALDARVGGSPFNVAVGLARLGQRVGFLGGISRDFLGEQLMRTLEREGVDTRAVCRSDAPTTLSLLGLDAAGVASYAFHGDGAADRALPLESLGALPVDAAAVHVGSFSAVVEPVASTLRSLVDRVQGRALVSYDPNVRLGVVPDAMVWRRHLRWMLPRTQLLKVSHEDLQVLQPGADADALARHWLTEGVSLVVLTRGADGATAWTPSCRVDQGPTTVQVVDTVGAGDTFQAALLAWAAAHGKLSGPGLAQLDEASLRDALSFAAQAAAITCTRRGADMPRREDIG